MDLKKPMSPKEFDLCLDRLDIAPILDSKVRQVKWLYNNSNKLTMVYDEKLVRLIVYRMSKEINDLKETLKNVTNNK